MEITKQQVGDHLEMTIKGRLDAYWADHLSKTLTEVIRGGAHHLRLDLAEVDFMSSAGIRVLLQYYKQLKGLKGSLQVSEVSSPVKMVLALAGFEALLGIKAESGPTPPQSVEPIGAESQGRLVERAGTTFEVFDSAPSASLTCCAVGDPALLLGAGFREARCQTMRFPQGSMAIGLGAFGHDFEDCRSRFGEFLAAAGAVAYRPTDGTGVPDYHLQSGAFLPDVQVLYGLTCEGVFAHLVRFEVKGAAKRLSLTDLVEAGLSIAQSDAVGIILVAETTGLVGAVLKGSPVLTGSEAPSGHPVSRDWVSFTPEQAYARCMTLVVGVAAGQNRTALGPLLRPLGKGPWPAGHFHAAAFSYRPLQEGEIDLTAAVTKLFNTGTPQGVVQLLADDRGRSGVAQSEFVRGACWVGPIAEITVEGITQ
jgi:anti-anti-sigma factor